MTTKVCGWGKCDREFEPRRHNQVYCCEEHASRAAKESILRRYHERKSMRKGKKRRCQCGTPLSRYNFTNRCSRCEFIESSRKVTPAEKSSVFDKVKEYNGR